LAGWLGWVAEKSAEVGKESSAGKKRGRAEQAFG